MAVPADVQEEIKELLDPANTTGVHVKLEKILLSLEKVGLAYKAMISPREIMCHPENRGTSMCNAHNVHLKGTQVLQSGLKKDLLPPNSLGIELAVGPDERSKQLRANQQMIGQSKGMLAPLQGGERFLSLASSHFNQFCRALDHGCTKADGTQLHMTPEIKALVESGWQWTMLKAEAAVMFPDLPAFCSMSMNAHNSNTILTNELEAMMELAALHRSGMRMQDAVQAVCQSSPSCKAYIDDCAQFMRLYSGGDTFPMLLWLDGFCDLACKASGHSLLVGEENTNLLAHYNFRLPGCQLNFLRIALLATILSSKRHQDGISKLVFKSDFDKLKGKSTTLAMEDLLSQGWASCQKVANKALGEMSFGKFCVRLVLHALQKEKFEKFSRDGLSFDSFQAIVEELSVDLEGGEHVPSSSVAAVKATDADKVKDLLKASPDEVAMLQNSHISVGKNYMHKDYKEQVFALEGIKDGCGVFKHVPLFGETLEVVASVEELKDWKSTKKEMCQLCPRDVIKDRLPEACPLVLDEWDKMCASYLLAEAYKENNKANVDMVAFTKFPNGLLALRKLKVKELQLYPVGTLAKVKDQHKTDDLLAKGAILVKFKGVAYQVQGFKAYNPIKSEEAGVVCAYFYVKATEDEQEANLQVIWKTYKDLIIPVLENPKQVAEQTPLLKGKDVSATPPAKKDPSMPDDALVADVTRLLQSHFTQQEQDMSALDYMVQLKQEADSGSGLEKKDEQPGEPVSEHEFTNAPWHMPSSTPVQSSPLPKARPVGTTEHTVQKKEVAEESETANKSVSHNSKTQGMAATSDATQGTEESKNQKDYTTVSPDQVPLQQEQGSQPCGSRPKLISSPQDMWKQLYGDGGILTKQEPKNQKNDEVRAWNGWAMKMGLLLLAWCNHESPRAKKMLSTYCQNKKMKLIMAAIKEKVEMHGWPDWTDPGPHE
ncbi:unnamed protein product [Durusdinium trenchii]|uniref:Uncharacterized protein n=2 Tax=Durusdinium trenchii TaxID=1381693 RepID=A0ABP0QGI2_9DINO